MAESYGWTGKLLRVDLTTGSITTESTEKYKSFLGGTGFGWKVLWDEVPPGTKAFDPENKLVFAVGPVTGSGSPCSGRTSITTLWPVHGDELPGAGHMGGHWGPELKYAGYDGIIVQGVSPRPVWLRIEDDKVTLEDASAVWGTGIYRTTNHIVNLMGKEAHVAAIGQIGEAKVRLSAVYTDRSHRAGGVGGIMGAKMLKAIGVRGTGAVKIKADKKTWKDLNKYYLSLMGANNNCVVARELQPWSEHSPGNTRWSGKKGLLWGAASPPIDLGTCPDVEHPTVDAPNPFNKIGLRTHKGFNDFGEEGQKRTVRMDGCHACPIRCHIAADHPELEQYGVSRYNMNTCIGNGGLRNSITNSAGSNPAQNPMLLAYMSNHLEGDYGMWSDYQGWVYVFNWAYSHDDQGQPVVAATIPNPDWTASSPPEVPKTIPNPAFRPSLFQKYLPAAEWTRLRTTNLWSTGKSPFGLLDAGDPRWLQFFVREIAANVPGTLGYYIGLGPAHLAKLWPELAVAFNEHEDLHMFKQAHTLHHSIESANQVGGFVNVFGQSRDANNHTAHNFYTNGLPNSAAKPLLRAIAQELATNPESYFAAPDESGSGKWAYPLKTETTEQSPMNKARAAFVAQSVIWYELQNCLTECNYTLPVWASPLKSREYRGDPTLNVKVLNAVTGLDLTHKDLEKAGLRIFTLWRVLTARILEHRNPGQGRNMRASYDYAYDHFFREHGSTDQGAFVAADFELGKDLMYEAFGWDKATGLPTAATLTALGLGDMIPTLEAEGLIPSATPA